MNRHLRRRGAPGHILRLALTAGLLFGLWLQPPSVNAAGYERIDAAAEALADGASLRETAQALAALGERERDKARAIFVWIARHIAYDTEGFFSGHLGDTSPEAVFASRVTVCDGYSRLFEAMASEAGLESVRVFGHSKGYGSVLGEASEGSSHAWNAVKIDGQWHLLDVTWAAGVVGPDHQFYPSFNAHYFLTPPARMVLDHYPEDPQWLLLDRPISREEYDRMPALGPVFFSQGLRLGKYLENTIHSESSQIQIPLFARKDTVLTANLQPLSTGEVLQRRLLVHQQGEQASILVSLPAAGSYELLIFARNRETKAGGWALSYRIDSSQPAPDKRGFPQTYSNYSEHHIELLEPLTGILPKNPKTRFRVRIPDATHAAVIVGNAWIPLKAEKGVFTGLVDLSRVDAASLVASFGYARSYSGVADYKVE